MPGLKRGAPLLLNGLSVDEIQALSAACFDAEGWITTANGKYPMVEQARKRAAELTLTRNIKESQAKVFIDLACVNFPDSASANAFLTKPSSSSEVVAAVKSLLG
jgi:hypothetical protein